jgi:RNA polymerase sigma-70 factor (ECF subfamily)
VISARVEELRQTRERFPSTRWSLIFSAQNRDAIESQDALNEICKRYWRPALLFVCRRGYPPSQAEDLVQEFFISISEGKLLGAATPARGRFRSLLLKSLQNFLLDAHAHSQREKRGGKFSFVSWDACQINMPSSCSAEAIFDSEWAVTIAEEATRRLREECESKGQKWIYDELIGYLDAERNEISYRALSAQLCMPEKTVKHLLHEFRKRYRSLLIEEVAETLEDRSDVGDELRYLCDALSRVAV